LNLGLGSRLQVTTGLWWMRTSRSSGCAAWRQYARRGRTTPLRRTAAGGSLWRPRRSRVVGRPAAAGMTRRHRSGEVLGARTFLLHVGGSGVTRPHLSLVMLLGRKSRHRSRGGGARTHHRQRATVQLIRMTCHHHESLGGNKTPRHRGDVLVMTLRSPRTSSCQGGV